jgi:citrate lyase subunit gamma (acyl carrier protein)
MKLVKTGVAGTLESSDIMVTLEPGEKGIEISLKSQVEKQFGALIRQVISETLGELGIDAARVTAVDKGALDCAIRARVKTAAYRACGAEAAGYEWKV